MKFETVTPDHDYTPPPRDPRDDDRAHSAYCAMHSIARECQARLLAVVNDRVVESDDGGVWIDMSTANLIVQIADKLNDDNRAKFLAMDVPRMGRTAWSVSG